MIDMASLKALAEKQIPIAELGTYMHSLSQHEQDMMLQNALTPDESLYISKQFDAKIHIDWERVGVLIELGARYEDFMLWIRHLHFHSSVIWEHAPHDLLYRCAQIMKFKKHHDGVGFCAFICSINSHLPLPYPLFLRNYVCYGPFSWLLKCTSEQRMKIANIMKWRYKQEIEPPIRLIKYLMRTPECFHMLPTFRRLEPNMLELACKEYCVDCVKYLLKSERPHKRALDYYYKNLPRNMYEGEILETPLFDWVCIVAILIDAGAVVSDIFLSKINPTNSYHWLLMKVLIDKKIVSPNHWAREAPQFQYLV